MSEPRDCFCYECREEGIPVDMFYKLIKEDKAPLTENEQDLLRAAGAEAIFGRLFLGRSSRCFSCFWTFMPV